jgi:DNA-binding IclR family transcriptional regulator
MRAPARRSNAKSTAKSAVKEDRQFVAALARGLDVLACFRTSDKVLSNQDIAERCKLPKSTVSRLTHTLTRLGYLQFVESSAKYRLGIATLALGSAMLARMNARQLARPHMQELAEATGAVVAMGTCAQRAMIYVEICRSRAPVTISLDVGARLPLATTALAQYKVLGCCSSFGEWQKDLNGIAAAIRPGGDMPILAISVGGPAFQLSPDFLLDVARPRLSELMRRLRVTLGAEQE